MSTNPSPFTSGLPLTGGTLSGPLTVNALLTVGGANDLSVGRNITASGSIQSNSGGFGATAGLIDIKTAGNGLLIAEGSNAKQGTATLVAGTVTVANTSVTANSRILLTCQALGTVTIPSALCVSARTAGTSFTILASQNTDTSTIAYEIFEPG